MHVHTFGIPPTTRFVPVDGNTTKRPLGLMPPLIVDWYEALPWLFDSPAGPTSTRVVVEFWRSRTKMPVPGDAPSSGALDSKVTKRPPPLMSGFFAPAPLSAPPLLV